MSDAVGNTYDRLVSEALQKYCKPSDERTRLLRTALVKRIILGKAVIHQLQAIDPVEVDSVDKVAAAKAMAGRFAESCEKFRHLNGPEHDFSSMDDEQLRTYGKLDKELTHSLGEWHAKDLEAVEEFLREHIEAVVEGVGDKEKADAVRADVSWASRLVRDEAGNFHGGKVAALAAGGTAIGVGAVALIHHRREAAKVIPPEIQRRQR